jgi:hypothetical protein
MASTFISDRNMYNLLESGLLVSCSMFVYGSIGLLRDIEHSAFPEIDFFDLFNMTTNVVYLVGLFRLIVSISDMSSDYKFNLNVANFNKELDEGVKNEDMEYDNEVEEVDDDEVGDDNEVEEVDDDEVGDDNEVEEVKVDEEVDDNEVEEVKVDEEVDDNEVEEVKVDEEVEHIFEEDELKKVVRDAIRDTIGSCGDDDVIVDDGYTQKRIVEYLVSTQKDVVDNAVSPSCE